MKRDQKFLSKLENELVKNKIKNRKEILLEYKNIIENRKSNKEKISDILKDFDSPENIVLNIKNTSYSSTFYQVHMFRGIYVGSGQSLGSLFIIFIAGHGIICHVFFNFILYFG